MRAKPFACTAFKALSAAVFLLSLLLSFAGTFRSLLYLLPPLSLGLLVASFALEKRFKEDGARRKALLRESSLFQSFRHDLANQLQIIICLSQLGRGERVKQALFSLSEKLKAFGEIKKGVSPDLAAELENLLFSLPAEVCFTFAVDLPPPGEIRPGEASPGRAPQGEIGPVEVHREKTMSEGALLAAVNPGQVPALTLALKSSRLARVSLAITGGEGGWFLQISARLVETVAGAGAVPGTELGTGAGAGSDNRAGFGNAEGSVSRARAEAAAALESYFLAEDSPLKGVCQLAGGEGRDGQGHGLRGGEGDAEGYHFFCRVPLEFKNSL